MFIDSCSNEKEKGPSEALPPLLKLLEPSSKLFKSYRKIPHYTDEVQFFHFGGLLESTRRISDGHYNKSSTAGYDLDSLETALLKFIGESLERYCLNAYKQKDLVLGSYNELRNRAIDIHTIVALSEKQRQNPKFTRFIIDGSTKFYWAQGISLKTGKSVLIPAQLVYLSYMYPNDEKVIYLPISTGAAGGTSLLAALRRGVCEVIERDAFMIAYLNKLSPPKVNLKLLKNKEIDRWLLLFERYHLEVSVLDITTEVGIPTFLTVVIDRTGIGVAVSCGLKTHPDPVEAIIGSLKESQHPRCWVRRLAEEGPNRIKKIQPVAIRTLEERALYWFPVERIDDIAFLLKQKPSKLKKYIFGKSSSEKKLLKDVLQKLWKSNMDAYFVDITLPKFRRLGYCLVKVIIPQTTPFYLNEQVPYLGGDRLYKVPKIIGLASHATTEESLNPIPHPFL